MNTQQQSSQELTSWKEIADYLHVSVRTAQKWEEEKGLPIHRLPGEKGRIRGYPNELDRWKLTALRNHNGGISRRFLIVYGVLATILLFFAVSHEIIYHLNATHGRFPSSFRLEWQSLIVMDQYGTELWRKAFPEAIETSAYSDASMAMHRKIAFTDLDGDGGLETLFVYAPVNSARNPGAVYCFSSIGEERWNFAPARTDSGTNKGFVPTHIINDLLIALPDGNSEPFVFLLDCRLPEHLATLFVLSQLGEPLATYNHRGHLGMLEVGDVDNCGIREILLGGFAGELHQAELIILDIPCEKLNRTGGQANAVRPPLPVRIAEKAIIAFPRTCVNRKLEESNRIARIANSGEILSVGVSELIEDATVEVTYQLDRHLRIQAVWFSDALRNLHQSLYAQGVLDHPLTEKEIEGFKEVKRIASHAPDQANAHVISKQSLEFPK